MDKEKKAVGELAGTIISTLAPQVMEKVMSGMQAGEQIDPHAAIDEVANQEGIQVDETTRQELIRQVDETQRETMKTMEQEATTFASNSKNELIQKLRKIYSQSNLDITRAVRAWKQVRLNPTMIRAQVQNDVGIRISLAEAKILHQLGSDLTLGFGHSDIGKTFANDILQKMMTKKSIKLTPSVREAVERVGRNVYRTKRANNVLWKIDVRHTDDGQQVPYLLRLETVEAEDENNTKG
jgi:hypothetical protein